MKINYPLHINKSNTVTDKKELTKYIWAYSLGDGSLLYFPHKDRPNEKINACFTCNQLKIHEDYIVRRADILSNITSLSIQNKPSSPDMLTTQSNRHPKFSEMRQRIYLNGVKIVEPHYLKLLDWETLAILHQDDGCLSIKDKDRNYFIVTLSTQSFSYGDNILLQRAIKDKTDILFSVTSIRSKTGNLQYRLMLQKQDEIDKFLFGIGKYISPSFEYKVNKNFRTISSQFMG